MAKRNMGVATAYELFLKGFATGRVSTGSSEIDALIGGGLKKGLFHLFYGEKESWVDVLIHQIVCYSVKEGKTCLILCGNYREEKTVVDSNLLIYLFRNMGLNMGEALNNLDVYFAFNPEQQIETFKEVAGQVEKGFYSCIIVKDIFKLFRGKRSSILVFQGIVKEIKEVCAEREALLVASCKPVNSRKKVPIPEGGKFLRHEANVIVYLKRRSSKPLTATLYLLKHPDRPLSKINVWMSLGGRKMGRITLPFRSVLEGEMKKLKKNYKEALLDPLKREAFEKLVRDWNKEKGAMSYADLPSVLDAIYLTGIVSNRKQIEKTLEEIKEIKHIIEKLEVKLKNLKQVKPP